MGVIEELKHYSKDVDVGLQRFLNDEAMYLECIQQFKEDCNFNILGHAIQERDYKKTFEASHNLKGAAGNLGLTPLYMVLSALVTKLREERYENLNIEYDLVMAEQEKLKNILCN